jgi:hypothetical protein
MLVSDLFGLIRPLISFASNLAEAASLWTSKEWKMVGHPLTLAWLIVWPVPLCFYFTVYGYINVKQTHYKEIKRLCL